MELKSFISSGNNSFSYQRGMAFKRFFEETSDLNLAGEIVKEIGVDKTLEMVIPLKESTGDFLIKYPVEKIKAMTKMDVRESVQEFQEVKVDKTESFFLRAEDSLMDVVYTFEGMIQKHKKEFGKWDGKERVNKLVVKLQKLVK